MIVLFVTPYFYPPRSGGELTLRSRAKALAQRGNKVFIRYNRGQPAPPDVQLNPGFAPIPNEERFVRAVVDEIKPDRLILSHLSHFELATLRKDGPPDMRIIYSPCYWREILQNPAALGEWLHGQPEPLNIQGVQALRDADLVIANSAFSQQIFARLDIQSTVAEPNIDLRTTLSSIGARDSIGVMGLHRHGRLPYQIAAAMPEQRFLFLDYERTADPVALRALPNVQQMGWTDQPSDFYSRTSVLLHPSHLYESYGRGIAEALANGIPVICSDRGHARSLVGDGGRVLPVETPAVDWARAIRQLLRNYEQHARLARLRGNDIIEVARCPGLVFALLVETAGE